MAAEKSRKAATARNGLNVTSETELKHVMKDPQKKDRWWDCNSAIGELLVGFLISFIDNLKSLNKRSLWTSLHGRTCYTLEVVPWGSLSVSIRFFWRIRQILPGQIYAQVEDA